MRFFLKVSWLFLSMGVGSVHAAGKASYLPIPQAARPQVITRGRPEPVPIAFVYRGGIAESPWAMSHELARRAAAAEFSSQVDTLGVEHVDTASEADRVFRDLAQRGYKVFFATDALHADAAARAAIADYDIKVEQAVIGETLINVRVFQIRHFEQAYLAGIIAAGHTSTRKLGIVATYPTPATMTEINAFALGAQSVDARINTRVVWIDSRSNPAIETSAAQLLVNRGVDVLLSTADSVTVAQFAERQTSRGYKSPRKISLIGWHINQRAWAPHAQVAAVTLNWYPFYKMAIKEAFDYLCTKTDTSRGYRYGAINVVDLSDALSRRAKTRLIEVQTGLSTDDFAVFRGPIHSREGAEVLPSDVVGDEVWRTHTKFLVQGVMVMRLPATNAAQNRWGRY